MRRVFLSYEYTAAEFRYNLRHYSSHAQGYHESSKRPGGQPGLSGTYRDGVLVDESPVSAPLDYLHGQVP